MKILVCYVDLCEVEFKFVVEPQDVSQVFTFKAHRAGDAIHPDISYHPSAFQHQSSGKHGE